MTTKLLRLVREWLRRRQESKAFWTALTAEAYEAIQPPPPDHTGLWEAARREGLATADTVDHLHWSRDVESQRDQQLSDKTIEASGHASEHQPKAQAAKDASALVRMVIGADGTREPAERAWSRAQRARNAGRRTVKVVIMIVFPLLGMGTVLVVTGGLFSGFPMIRHAELVMASLLLIFTGWATLLRQLVTRTEWLRAYLRALSALIDKAGENGLNDQVCAEVERQTESLRHRSRVYRPTTHHSGTH